MKDIHGQAILDCYKGLFKGNLILHNTYDTPEEMPVEVFFREEEDLTTLELLALVECSGKVLDLGAGAGVHSLILQARDFDVVALENSPGCVEVLKQSGVQQVVFQDYQKHAQKYDTVLALMNGLGIAGMLSEVPAFLKKCKSLLNPGGQILVDSSDINYLYTEEGVKRPSGYYGEVCYQYEYNRKKGDWFDWVYVDQKTLLEICKKEKLSCEILHTDENDQYLACIK